MRWALLAAVLASTVAHGQRIRLTSPSTGGSCTLDGSTQAVATSYRATTTTGTGYQCDATLASCIDLGPGTNNYIGTNVAGEILLGPGSGNSTVVRVFGSLYVSNITQSGGAFDSYFNAYLTNTFTGMPLAVNDAEGLRIVGSTSLVACSATLRNTLKPLTFADGSGEPDRLCWCRTDNAASPTYRWVNVLSGSVGTTATECPL